jgi:hypothetical protein
MNHVLLKIVASAALGNTPTGADAAFPVWNGPDSAVVRIQAILYSSLSASLLAAFIGMLGKQWLNRYASVERGSIIDRGRQRKRKMDGIVTWQFDLVMECLPLMLQGSLLLLGCALSDYLFFINKAIAGVLIGFTSFGLLFYFLIISAATFSYNCPFQTPLSLIFRFMIRFDNEHKKYLERSRKWLGHSFSRTRYPRRKSNGPDGNAPGDHIDLLIPTPPDQPPPIFHQVIDWDGYLLDSDCIAWMFKMPMDIDVTMAIARVIPEIVWHAGIRATPLERLYDMLLECFDRSSGDPRLRPAFKDGAYLCAKAFLHMAIQHRCIGDESGNVAFESISDRHRQMSYIDCEGDVDLESTLRMIDYILNSLPADLWQLFFDFGPMHRDHLFTIPHHSWIGHILLYHAWDVTNKGDAQSHSVKGFVSLSLQLVPPPPPPIVADCLFVIGLVLGIKLHVGDLLVADKR